MKIKCFDITFAFASREGEGEKGIKNSCTRWQTLLIIRGKLNFEISSRYVRAGLLT
jgi:hypothetical protein